ncbi:MAG: terminase B [Acidobacteria bacterium]|nr:MAG: terminase B [Acidobacteriota bacterium]
MAAEIDRRPGKLSVEDEIRNWQNFVLRYRNAPVLFVREVLHAEPDEWQAQVLEAIAAGERRISVRSGHGVGKSTCASWASLWYLLTRYTVKIVVTAPSASQLYDALFAEIKTWVRRLPGPVQELFEVKSERIELKAAPTEAFISARTSRAEQPEALQGVHADYVMLIADEASGIPEQVFEAAAGSMSGHNAVTLLLGNPVRSSGFFYDTHHRLAGEWRTFHVSCLNSQRVSPDFLRDMAARYGEDSNAYRIRVLGEFPKGDDDTVLPMELIEAAWQRDIEIPRYTPEVWGLDVARFGSDQTALCKRRGRVVTEVRRWAGLDLMETAGAVFHEYEIAGVKPQEILVDAIGLGAGVVDRLRELGLPVRGINVSESAASSQKYANLRAELWFAMREWFAEKGCKIPRDERLIEQLAAVRYKFTSNGRLQIESKDELRRRMRGQSPDEADALALTFASTAATLAAGAVRQSWDRPIRVEIGLVA